jgi:aspartate kinase
MKRSVSVVKIGGSLLADRHAYRTAAALVADRITANPGQRLIVVVSAEAGATDALLSMACDIVEKPDARVVDLLWSTGEVRSAALLTLWLHALGVRAAAADVQQAGVHCEAENVTPSVRPLRLRALLAENDVVVVPGFLACSGGDGIASLGRGGSDLTAILLAASLNAGRCELLKDVDGYFTADPKEDPAARPIPWLPYARALHMAEEGCALVQRAALEAARDQGIEVVISGVRGYPGTRVSASLIPHGYSEGE